MNKGLFRFCLLAVASSALHCTLAVAASGLLTDSKRDELLNALDLSLPQLEAVRTAVEAGDRAAAATEFARYLRTRTIDTWRFNPRDDHRGIPFNREVADNAVIGRVVGGHVKIWKTFPDNEIDWEHNETRALAEQGTGVPYNKEWQWQLTRMYFWNDMANAYRSTGDEKYAKAWAKQLRSFVVYPVPEVPVNGENNLPDSVWRSLEAGLRLHGSWPVAWNSFVLSPSVRDEDLLLFAHSVLEHAHYLKRGHSAWGNWLLTEMHGLYVAGVLFPEFRDAPQWRDYAVQKINADISNQFPPDGLHYEYTPGYHVVSLENVTGIPQLAKIGGFMDELPEGFTASIENAFDALMYLQTPRRNQPRMNDTWGLDVRPLLRRGLEFFPEREDWRWIATDGAEGSEPASTSHFFDYSGFVVMRSGWEQDANYAVFDIGPLGYAHYHQDKLNLIVYAYGREMLFDNGGGSYEESPWRRWSMDTYSHNTVLVDGKPQRRPSGPNWHGEVGREPITDAHWQSNAQYDYAVGRYEQGYGHVNDKIASHIRRVYFHKPDVFIAVDSLLPGNSNPRTYQARWHLITPETVFAEDGFSVITNDEGQPNLAVVPLLTEGLEVRAVSAQTEPELLGWDVRKDSNPQSVPATTVTHTVSGTGAKRLVTLLLPLREDEPRSNPVTNVNWLSADRVEVTLRDGRTLRIDLGKGAEDQITVQEMNKP